MNAAERVAVQKEAASWIGTPYHHQASIKGIGVDCAMHLIATYSNAGLIERFDPRPYSPDWWMHKDEEIFLKWVEKFADRVEQPLPGDMAIYKFGRCFAHGSVVLGWPNIVHAYYRSGVCEPGLGNAGDLASRPVKFYSLRV